MHCIKTLRKTLTLHSYDMYMKNTQETGGPQKMAGCMAASLQVVTKGNIILATAMSAFSVPYNVTDFIASFNLLPKWTRSLNSGIGKT